MREVHVTDVPLTAQIIDVREPEEYVDGHAVGAVNIPVAEIPERINEIDQDSDIYVICNSGGRSAQIVQWLGHAGIEAINVIGGTKAWRAADLPLEG